MGPFAEFNENLRQGRFCMQHCRNCARVIFSPRLFCPACKSGDYEWRDVAGAGIVHAVTIIARHPDKGGDYNVVMVDLDNGARMMSRVIDIAPDDLRIGMPVKAVIGEDADGPLVEFRPAG